MRIHYDVYLGIFLIYFVYIHNQAKKMLLKQRWWHTPRTKRTQRHCVRDGEEWHQLESFFDINLTFYLLDMTRVVCLQINPVETVIKTKQIKCVRAYLKSQYKIKQINKHLNSL